MNVESGRAQAGVEKIGDSAEKTTHIAVRAMKAVSAGIGAATAAAAAQERSWLTLGATILSTFAAGGPIAGGIAVIGAGIGLLVGSTKEAKEAAQKLEDAWTESFNAMRETTKGLADDLAEATKRADAMAKMVGAGVSGTSKLEGFLLLEDLQKAREAWEKARASSRDLGLVAPDIWGVDSPAPGSGAAGQHAAKELEELRRQKEALEARLQQFTRGEHASATLEAREDAKKANDELRERLRLLRIEDDLERDLERIRVEAEGLRKRAGAAGTPAEKAAGISAADEFERRASMEAVAKARLAEAAKVIDERDTHRARVNEALAKWAAEQDQAAKSIAEKVKDASQAYDDSAAKANAVDETEQERVDLNRKVTDLLAQGATWLQAQEVYAKGLASIEAREEARKRAADDAAAKKAKEKADADAERAKEVREEGERDIRKEIDLLNATDDARREMVELEAKIADYRKKGVDEGLLAELRTAGMGKIARDKASKVDEETRQFIDSMKQTISGGLTDAIVDGITNGFRNGSDIGRAIFDAMLRQTIGSLVTTGVNALFGAIGGGGTSSGSLGILSTIIGASSGSSGGASAVGAVAGCAGGT